MRNWDRFDSKIKSRETKSVFDGWSVLVVGWCNTLIFILIFAGVVFNSHWIIQKDTSPACLDLIGLRLHHTDRTPSSVAVHGHKSTDLINLPSHRPDIILGVRDNLIVFGDTIYNSLKLL